MARNVNMSTCFDTIPELAFFRVLQKGFGFEKTCICIIPRKHPSPHQCWRNPHQWDRWPTVESHGTTKACGALTAFGCGLIVAMLFAGFQTNWKNFSGSTEGPLQRVGLPFGRTLMQAICSKSVELGCDGDSIYENYLSLNVSYRNATRTENVLW